MDSDNKNPKSFTEEPIKKHRGRKPKIKEPVEIKEKKKRGRKPKVKEPEDTVKVFKKRGRKPIGKIIDFSKDNTSISIDDDYIARIPLHPNDFNKLLVQCKAKICGTMNPFVIRDSIESELLLCLIYFSCVGW